MISARSLASATPENGITFPGMTFSGSVTKPSNVLSSHVTLDPFIARLNRKPGTSPALLPTIPFNVGPTPLLPLLPLLPSMAQIDAAVFSPLILKPSLTMTPAPRKNVSWPTRLPDSRFLHARQLGAANAFIATSRIVARVLVVRGSAMGC